MNERIEGYLDEILDLSDTLTKHGYRVTISFSDNTYEISHKVSSHFPRRGSINSFTHLLVYLRDLAERVGAYGE